VTAAESSERAALLTALLSGPAGFQAPLMTARRLADKGLVEVISTNEPQGLACCILTSKGRAMAQHGINTERARRARQVAPQSTARRGAPVAEAIREATAERWPTGGRS
jgi:hypothetical protein